MDPTIPRYQIYSAHDTQIAHILYQIFPEWLDWDYVRYASYFTIELRVNHNCFNAITMVSIGILFLQMMLNVDICIMGSVMASMTHVVGSLESNTLGATGVTLTVYFGLWPCICCPEVPDCTGTVMYD